MANKVFESQHKAEEIDKKLALVQYYAKQYGSK